MGKVTSLSNSTNNEGFSSLFLLTSQLPLTKNGGVAEWLWMDSTVFICLLAIYYCWRGKSLESTIEWSVELCVIISAVDNSARLLILLAPLILS